VAENFGIDFVVGATVGASVAAAFATVESKIKATQASFASAFKTVFGPVTVQAQDAEKKEGKKTMSLDSRAESAAEAEVFQGDSVLRSFTT
jgi:hypothetical protein